MAAPSITIASESLPASGTSMTTLTGGDGFVEGYTGADYALQWGTPAYDTKFNGGFQLANSIFGATLPTYGSYYWGGATYAMSDRVVDGSADDSTIASLSRGQTTSFAFGSETSNGIEWQVACGQALRTFHFLGISDGGPFEVTVSLSDASVVGTPFLLIPGSNSSFKAAFRSMDEGTATIRITKTGAATGYVAPRAVYLEVPVARPHASGRNRIRRAFR